MKNSAHTYRTFVLLSCFALGFCNHSLFGQTDDQLIDSLIANKSISEQLQTLSEYAVGIRKSDILLGAKVSERALEIARDSGTQQNIARAIYDMGAIYHLTDRYDSAKIFYHQSMNMFKEINDSVGVSDTYINLGILYRILSEFDKSFAWLEEARQIKYQLKDTTSIIRCLISLGNGHYALGEYNDALKYYEETLVLNEHLNNPAYAVSLLNNIGTLYEIQNKYNQALQNYSRALVICDSLNFATEKALVLKNMGLIYIQIGKNKKALDVLFQALYIRDSLKLQLAKASTLNIIGKVYETEKNPQRANELYIQSLKIDQEMGNMDGVATTLIFIGENLRKKGEYKSAMSYFRHSLAIASEYGLKLNISEVYRNLIHVFGSQNENDSVKKYLDLYLEINKGFDIDFGDEEATSQSTHDPKPSETIPQEFPIPTYSPHPYSILIGYFSIFMITGLIVFIFLLLAFLLNKRQFKKKFYRKISKP